MITEDYVSFETAKLLKEKGFDASEIDAYFPFVYYSDGKMDFYDDDKPLFVCEAVTLQMACKWLREVHNIFIEISVDEMLKDEGYQWALYYNSTKEIRPYSGWGDSYEESCEAAIKYCLDNLV